MDWVVYGDVPWEEVSLSCCPDLVPILCIASGFLKESTAAGTESKNLVKTRCVIER